MAAYSLSSPSSYRENYNLDSSTANLTSDILIVDNNDLSQIKLNKKPKKILHFSDGTMEVSSSEDEDELDGSGAETNTTVAVNPKMLDWGPWIMYHTLLVGSTSLKVCDYLGENLASFFGITTPKYQYEIDEYKRMVAEEEEQKKQQDLEMGGWTEGSSRVIGTEVTGPPMSTDFHSIPPPSKPASASSQRY